MYSNNIVNFEESTTILNAHTKKVWKRIESSTYIRRLASWASWSIGILDADQLFDCLVAFGFYFTLLF